MNGEIPKALKKQKCSEVKKKKKKKKNRKRGRKEERGRRVGGCSEDTQWHQKLHVSYQTWKNVVINLNHKYKNEQTY